MSYSSSLWCARCGRRILPAAPKINCDDCDGFFHHDCFDCGEKCPRCNPPVRPAAQPAQKQSDGAVYFCASAKTLLIIGVTCMLVGIAPAGLNVLVLGIGFKMLRQQLSRAYRISARRSRRMHAGFWVRLNAGQARIAEWVLSVLTAAAILILALSMVGGGLFFAMCCLPARLDVATGYVLNSTRSIISDSPVLAMYLGGAVLSLINLPFAFLGIIVYWIAVCRLQLVRSRRQALADGNVTIDQAEGNIVYFRSFQDDDDWFVGPQGKVFFLSVTAEERMIRALKGHVDVFAIGHPMEKLPAVGAHRLYFDNDNWQAAALFLMSKAALVLLRPQPSEWVMWELRNILSNIHPSQLVMWLPESLDQSGWEEFCDQSWSQIRLSLPKGIGRNKLILFDEDWQFRLISFPAKKKEIIALFDRLIAESKHKKMRHAVPSLQATVT